MSSHAPLPDDPIELARANWVKHGWDDAAEGMALVTSVMRVQQVFLARIEAILRPYGLTFARYEVLRLLAFTRRGVMPVGKIGERLQVHATSVTPLVKRLEAAELIRRTPHPEDGRAVLASITSKGLDVMDRATQAIVDARFGLSALSEEECDQLTWLLTMPREAAGDF